jgi:hypothetical protein
MSELVRTIVNTQTGEVMTAPLSSEEIEALHTAEAARLSAQAERDAAEAARLASKESARAKLAALGLTDEEISAIVGG